jgi:hypothetical protein
MNKKNEKLIELNEVKNFKIECGVMEHLNKFKFLGKLFLLFNTLGFPRLINYGVSEG